MRAGGSVTSRPLHVGKPSLRGVYGEPPSGGSPSLCVYRRRPFGLDGTLRNRSLSADSNQAESGRHQLAAAADMRGRGSPRLSETASPVGNRQISVRKCRGRESNPHAP